MPVRTQRGEQIAAIAAWLKTLNPDKSRVFAYGVLFTIFTVVLPNLPRLLSRFIWPLVIAAVVAAVFVYRTN